MRRLADDGGRVDGIFAVRDAGDVEDGIEIFERIEAGVVAEGAFGAEFVEMDVAFENDLRCGGNFEVNGLALHQFDGLLAQESGDEIFLDIGRRGNDGGKCDGGIGADGDGNFHFAPETIAFDQDRAARGAGHDVHRQIPTGGAARGARACCIWKLPGAGLRGSVRRRLSGVASACPWCARRKPACGTSRRCVCRSWDHA